ncbi:MAG: carbon storage regulator [Oscillospiraceae bacterium]|nr:carbon storage regulator [Oscillospiraceae bacterium]
MLKLTLTPDEYLTIDGKIVVQLMRVAGGHADLAVHAERSIPIVRGEVLEREGAERPACLEPPPKKRARSRRDQFFRWNDDRERAVRVMKQVMDQLDRSGSGEAAAILRTQLDRIIPAVWEEELAK